MSVFFPPDRVPRFDVLLLGLGPDGHTCSLFPGHKLLNETSLWVCPINDSPKPPLCRITLTLPVINNARKCIFAAVGSSKAEVVKVLFYWRFGERFRSPSVFSPPLFNISQRILQDRESLPAARVQPQNGELFWILDEDAAEFLDAA